MEHSVSIWKPLKLDPAWYSVSTAKLDNILPSWRNKREHLKKDLKEYEKFINRLKRQHAIETGIVEKLYDLKDGITETFVKEGFVESYLQHGDTNVSPKKLMSYLNDHFEAIDFIFDLVKSNRKITKSFILELHQLITSHQETTEAIDSLGNIVQVELLKGQFKKHENNPKRKDGSIFLYCSPIQVESEIDTLLGIYQQLLDNQIHPLIIAAWFHHSFVQIHPFQDGNGRMARLLASLILIKADLFPFTVNRDEKKQYIQGLEAADNENYQPIIDFFCDTQVRNIEQALNMNTDLVSGSFSQVIDHFAEKVLNLKVKAQQEREQFINENRKIILSYSGNVLKQLVSEIQERVGSGVAINLDMSDSRNLHYFTHQIAQYASQHNYFFNSALFRGWFRLRFELLGEKKYQLVISVHHYGYDDNTIAIGAFMEIITEFEKEKFQRKENVRRDGNGKGNFITAMPLEIKPLTISAERGIKDLEPSIKSFLEDTVTIALAHIASNI